MEGKTKNSVLTTSIVPSLVVFVVVVVVVVFVFVDVVVVVIVVVGSPYNTHCGERPLVYFPGKKYHQQIIYIRKLI